MVNSCLESKSTKQHACQRPNFLVIGAGKCATTSLCSMLGEHPDVFIPKIKEPCFFSDDGLYHRKGWRWYESLFAAGSSKQLRGEGTTLYTMRERYPLTAARIAEAMPDGKLIYLVRHPMRRIESHWIQDRENGDSSIPSDFGRAVREHFDWYVKPSDYGYQLEAYYDHFSKDQLLVLFYEDFRKDPLAVMRRCLAFLGADPSKAPEDPDPHANISEGKQLLDPRFDRWRETPVVRSVKRFLPTKLKYELTRRLFVRTRWSGRPTWDPDCRNDVVDVLSEPTRRFLLEHGRDADFWAITA